MKYRKEPQQPDGLTSRSGAVRSMLAGCRRPTRRKPVEQVMLDLRRGRHRAYPAPEFFVKPPLWKKTMKSLKQILDTLRNQTITPEPYKNSFPQLFITDPENPSYDDLSMSDKLSLYLELAGLMKTHNDGLLSTISTITPETPKRTRNPDILAQAIAMTTPLVYKYYLGEIKFRKSFEHSDGHHIKRGEVAIWIDSAAINDLPLEIQEVYRNLINSGSMLIVNQHNLLAIDKEYLNLKKIKSLT